MTLLNRFTCVHVARSTSHAHSFVVVVGGSRNLRVGTPRPHNSHAPPCGAVASVASLSARARPARLVSTEEKSA